MRWLSHNSDGARTSHVSKHIDQWKCSADDSEAKARHCAVNNKLPLAANFKTRPYTLFFRLVHHYIYINHNQTIVTFDVLISIRDLRQKKLFNSSSSSCYSSDVMWQEISHIAALVSGTAFHELGRGQLYTEPHVRPISCHVTSVPQQEPEEELNNFFWQSLIEIETSKVNKVWLRLI